MCCASMGQHGIGRARGCRADLRDRYGTFQTTGRPADLVAIHGAIRIWRTSGTARFAGGTFTRAAPANWASMPITWHQVQHAPRFYSNILVIAHGRTLFMILAQFHLTFRRDHCRRSVVDTIRTEPDVSMQLTRRTGAGNFHTFKCKQ